MQEAARSIPTLGIRAYDPGRSLNATLKECCTFRVGLFRKGLKGGGLMNFKVPFKFPACPLSRVDHALLNDEILTCGNKEEWSIWSGQYICLHQYYNIGLSGQ